MAWSAVHGAAFLMIDDRLMTDQPNPSPERVLELLHDGIWSGIGKR